MTTIHSYVANADAFPVLKGFSFVMIRVQFVAVLSVAHGNAIPVSRSIQ
ncbi:MAG TPA: hypothetical protein VFC78_04105 [Tepidisphaeraceae bacterium]|nr:hypothetical protein [Tepidisphaeraceae bacterium]